MFLDRGTIFFCFSHTIFEPKLGTLFNMYIIVKLQSCVKWECGTMGKNSLIFFFLVILFIKLFGVVLTKSDTKTNLSFLLSQRTLFILQPRIFFYYYFALFYGYFKPCFMSPWDQLLLQGKDYALLIFVSPSTHVTYGFIRESGVVRCLINWLDFFPESFHITSVTFLHGRGFGHQFTWYQLMSAYQIGHKLPFPPNAFC